MSACSGRQTSEEEWVVKLRCISGHQWVGCKCARCDAVRDRDHDWDHCKCRRCNVFRDAEHDLEAVGCRLRCRRCGLDRGWMHEWRGCVCVRCKAEQHEWRGGVCEVCGEHCTHPAEEVVWICCERFGIPSIDPPYHQVCRRCGERVDKGQPPSSASSGEDANSLPVGTA